MSADSRKAASEARRAKLLARGDSRLAKITGTLPDATPTAAARPSHSIGAQPSTVSSRSPSSVVGAPAAAAGAPGPSPAAAAASRDAAPPRARSPALATELTAAVRKSSSAQELVQAAAARSVPQRRVGTATNGKWAQYAAPSGGTASPVRPRRLRQVSAGETLSAAVLGTSRLRLLLAALLAVLLATQWDAAAVGRSVAATGSSGNGSGGAVPASSRSRSSSSASSTSTRSSVSGTLPGGTGFFKSTTTSTTRVTTTTHHTSTTSGPLGGLAHRIMLSLLSHPLFSSLPGLRQLRAQLAGPPPPPPPPPPRQPVSQLLGAVQAKLAAAAATPAGQQVAAALQAVQASPVGQQVAAAVKWTKAKLAGAAASPVGRQAVGALGVAQAKLAAAAAAASPAVQQASWALRAVAPRLAALVSAARQQAVAALASPAGRKLGAALEKLPPFANVVLLDLSLVGAAAVTLAAMPSLVHSTLELDLQTPGLLTRLASAVPGLTQQLSLLAAWQRLLVSLLDDAAAFVATLVCYQLLPQLAAAAAGSGGGEGQLA